MKKTIGDDKNMDIIPRDEQVEGRYFKRSKDRFGYKIPNTSLDKDVCINIKYGILDISLAGNIIFPKGCGAYVITTVSGSVYVGSTKDISKRLSGHISQQRIRVHPNIFEPITKIQIYATETPVDAKILEYWLIKELKPQLNLEFLPRKSV